MSKTILELRGLLAKSSPAWAGAASAMDLPQPKTCWATGWPKLDALLEGGLPTGALAEWVAPVKGSGGASAIRLLLNQCHRTGSRMALIDGQDSFDPGSCEPAVLSRLLWVRCRTAGESLKAADLLLRDGNMPLIVLDLAMNPSAQLRKIPATTWYRFQRVIERTATILVIVTPSPMVSGAEVRLQLRKEFSIESLSQTEQQLAASLDVELSRGEARRDQRIERFA